MAVCRIIDTGVSPEQYEKVRDKVGARDNPPDGGQLHIAAKGTDGTIRIIEIWDTREQAEAFGEKVRAAREEMGVGGPPPPVEKHEQQKLHSLLTAQQAPA
jgi:hypothetical protein